jgi:transposase
MQVMARPSKYNREFGERAVRLVLEQREEYPSEFEAIRSVAAKLGIGSAETLRKWVRRACNLDDRTASVVSGRAR